MTDSTHLKRPCNPKEPPERDKFPDVSLPPKRGKENGMVKKQEPTRFCKPDFVRRTEPAVRSFFSRGPRSDVPRARSLSRNGCDYYPGIRRAGDPSPVCLASRGVYHASLVTLGAVSSYLPFSPLPGMRRTPSGRFVFCGTFRPGTLGRFPSPAFTGHAAL